MQMPLSHAFLGLLEEGGILKEAEGLAMVWGYAEGSDGATVCLGGIAFVDLPPVTGKLGGEPAHHLVSVGLGKY